MRRRNKRDQTEEHKHCCVDFSHGLLCQTKREELKVLEMQNGKDVSLKDEFLRFQVGFRAGFLWKLQTGLTPFFRCDRRVDWYLLSGG